MQGVLRQGRDSGELKRLTTSYSFHSLELPRVHTMTPLVSSLICERDELSTEPSNETGFLQKLKIRFPIDALFDQVVAPLINRVKGSAHAN
jgi:hypothetical protein